MLLLAGGVFAWSTVNTPQAVDLGVSYSQEALQSFNDKIGQKVHGIVAGGIPVGDSFSSAEFTSFLTVSAKAEKLPIQNIQVRFHQNSFEASFITQKFFFIKGAVYISGSVQIKEPRKIQVSIQDIRTESILPFSEAKNDIEQELNEGIQRLFNRYGPDERFLRIQKLQISEDQLLVDGIFPLEFFPDSKIRL